MSAAGALFLFGVALLVPAIGQAAAWLLWRSPVTVATLKWSAGVGTALIVAAALVWIFTR